jgi:hypothetical protein
MSDDDTTEKTFTQADVNKLLADERRKQQARYADYDDLKAKAAEADKAVTQLDKIQQQMTAMSERAEKSERQTMLREVADELKISVKKAERLKGNTKEELLSDGRDFYADELSKGTTTSDDNGTTGQQTPPEPAATRGRPKETLRSGAPMTPSTAEETDPRKLAALIPRN